MKLETAKSTFLVRETNVSPITALIFERTLNDAKRKELV